MITIERSKLAELTAAAASVARKGAITPAGELVFLSVADGVLTAKATDTENWLALSVECSGDMPDVQVDAGKLADLVGKMRGDIVKLDVVAGDLTLAAKGGGKRKIGGMTAPYPTVKAPDTEESVFEADHLRACIAFAAGSMADDMIAKPQYCGVHIHDYAGAYYAAAYNGHSGFAAIRVGNADQKLAFTLPAATIKLLRWIPDGAQVSMRVGDRLMSLSWNGGEVIGKRMKGQFVPYRQRIPEHSAHLSIRREELLSGIRSVLAVAADENASKSKLIEIALGETVSVNVASQSGQASEPLDATWDGEPMTIRFSSRRLEEAVSGFGSDEIRIGISPYADEYRNTLPVSFHSVQNDAKFAMLMPIQ